MELKSPELSDTEQIVDYISFIRTGSILNTRWIMDEEWKVRYCKKDIVKVTDWMTEQSARRYFNRLKNEKVLVTEWAELIYASLDEDAKDEEQVVDNFERRKIEIAGQTLLGKVK